MKIEPDSQKASDIKVIGLLVVSLAVITTINIRLSEAQTANPPVRAEGGDISTLHSSSSTPEDNIRGQIPPSIREKIRADIEARSKDLKNNQDVRRTMLDQKLGSTTNVIRAMGPDQKPKYDPYNSTSTIITGSDRQTVNRSTKVSDFLQKKTAVTEQFKIAMDNLTNLRERIGSRVAKEQQAGKDMSQANTLLVAADTKLSQLKSDISALQSYAASIPTDQSIASSSINIDSARSLVNAVQNSIRSSQKALSAVIVEIANAVGVELDNASVQ